VLAAHLRKGRLAAMDPAVELECERICRAASQGDRRRRGAGRLIASAVTDGTLGMGAHAEALVRWFSETDPGDVDWSRACGAAHDLARSRVRSSGEAVR